MSRTRKVQGFLNVDRKVIGGHPYARGEVLLEAVVPENVTLDKLTLLTTLDQLGWRELEDADTGEQTQAKKAPAKKKKQARRRSALQGG